MVILLIAIVMFPVGLQPVQQSTNVAVVGVLSTRVTLQWDAPSEPNIATSVSCTPHSPGCAECTTSPCTITSLTQDTEYNFTVTLSDGICKTSTNTTSSRTKGKFECGVGVCVTRTCQQFCMRNLSIKDTLRLGPLGVSTIIVTISGNSTVSHLSTPLAHEVFLPNSDLCMLNYYYVECLGIFLYIIIFLAVKTWAQGHT